MNTLASRLRFAFRQLRKAPGFSLTVILTLALGIGATTAIFSLVEGVLLRPLPFAQPDRLVLLGDHLGESTNISVTAREISTYLNATNAFSAVGAFVPKSYEVSGSSNAGGTPEEVAAARLTAGVFTTLGVQPVLGRVFTTQEENAHQPLAVISYALWLTRYHSDPGIAGKPIVLDRKTYEIIGVMPRNFEFPLAAGNLDQTQLWVPMSLGTEDLSEQNSGLWGYSLIARLKPGVTRTQAAQDADRVARQIMRDFPPGMSALHIRGDVIPLLENTVSDVRPLLRTLFFAVAVVLLIACINVAGMMLVRAIRRRREYAVRLALGARSSAILGQSVLEGLLLSLAGGLLGLALAAAIIRTTLHLLPDSMPRIHSIAIDGGVVGFALLVALATGILCSLAPAFAALRTNLLTNLKDGSQTGTGSSGHSWLRSTLVVSEIAIALVLLTVAGAFLRSFQKMRAVDPGYRPDHVLVAGYQLPLGQYPTDAAENAFNQQVIERLSNKPSVVHAATTSILPGEGWGGSAFTVEGVPTAGWKLKFAMFASITGDYFHAMGIPLLEGRAFTPDDRADTPLVIVVNETMAKHAWPGPDAIGKRMHVGNPKKNYPWATVVGVVGDTKRGALDEADEDQWYNPALQPATLFGPNPTGARTGPGNGYIVVRSALPPEQMIQTLRTTVAEVDPQLALQQVQSMNDVVSEVEAPRRFNTGLITGFALGALLLAVTGIYAIVAFSVSLRTQEIAIRMALGAGRENIARLVLGSSAKLAMFGCGLGLLGSWAVSRLVASFLFGVTATDPYIYFLAALAMMLLALLASALPAKRAASADPVRALRAS
jgi:putative ABC transport system permease protein